MREFAWYTPTASFINARSRPSPPGGLLCPSFVPLCFAAAHLSLRSRIILCVPRNAAHRAETKLSLYYTFITGINPRGAARRDARRWFNARNFYYKCEINVKPRKCAIASRLSISFSFYFRSPDINKHPLFNIRSLHFYDLASGMDVCVRVLYVNWIHEMLIFYDPRLAGIGMMLIGMALCVSRLIFITTTPP